MDARYNGFLNRFDGNARQNEPMSKYTTFRTGGNADLFVEITESQKLTQAIGLADELEIPWFVIGGGSNLLLGDDGFTGLIIRNRIQGLEVQGNEIICGAGEDLDRVVDSATEHSLTGFEFAAGIWGYIGGAVYGNAGAFGSDVGSLLSQAELVDTEGRSRTELNGYFDFSYRHSKLKQTGEIVSAATFCLETGDPGEIARRTAEIRQLRESKHPLQENSAGCIFKNIEDPRQPLGKLPAGKLLEDIGAKELSIGGASVFEKHANIIINTGNATSKDIRRLVDIMKEKVKKEYDIELQEEIISVGNF